MGTSGGAKPSTNGGDGGRVVPESLEALELLPLWEHPLGEVFSAGDAKTARALQLTVLRQGLVRGEQALRRCVDTNAMLADMESPFIPALLEARRVADGRVVLAMERLGGMPLGRHMLAGPMVPGRVIAIVRQICRALDVAHGIGVRHGALSMASVILVEHQGRADTVRLVDFGLEDELTAEAMAAHEVEMQPLSPEKLAGRGIDAREDVYLLGAVGYAALAGRPLFKGDATAVRAAHERGTPDALDCDAPLADVILRCLEKDPAKRFADMRSLDDALIGAQELSGLRTAWDDLRPMAGSSTSGSHTKGKSVTLGSIGKIPGGPYGVVTVDKGKPGMTPAEKLAEKLKAEKKPEPEGAKTGMTPAEKLAERLKKSEPEGAKTGMTPAEKLAERLKAERRAEAEKRLKAEADAKAKGEAEKPEPAKKLELKQVEPEKKLEAQRNLSPSASATFDATELIEDVQLAGESGAFPVPPAPPPIKRKDEASGRHAAATPPAVAGAKPAATPVAAPPPATKAKGASSSGSSFDRAATLGSVASSSSADRASAMTPGISGTSGSFERAATLGVSLGRTATPAGKAPAVPPMPTITGKPVPVPVVDSDPIALVKREGQPTLLPTPIPKIDSKPLVGMPGGLPKVDSKPLGVPVAMPKPDTQPMAMAKIDSKPLSVPKADSKPTPMAKVDSKPLGMPLSVPKVDSKPTPMAKVDSKPLGVPVAMPKPDTKPTAMARIDSKPLPMPLPVPKVDSKPTAAAAPEPAAPRDVADAAVSMSLDVVKEPEVVSPTATTAEEPKPLVAIVPPRIDPDATFDEPRKKPPAWLLVAGLALLVGVPALWLAMRDDPAKPTTAAAEGKPAPSEGTATPEPTPPATKVTPKPTPPVDDGAVASGGTPAPDLVADPDGGTPPAVEPEPKPERPSSGGGGSSPASAPTAAEKARELIRAGDKAYGAGQLAKAEGKYKAALGENPRAHAAAAGLGRIAFNKAAYAEASTYYGRAVKASGSNGEYRILYGDALFKLGKFADAKVQYTKAKSLGNGQADGRLKKVQAKLGS